MADSTVTERDAREALNTLRRWYSSRRAYDSLAVVQVLGNHLLDLGGAVPPGPPERVGDAADFHRVIRRKGTG